MYRLECFCGTQNKSFKKNIGKFYGGECCKEAGFGIAGERISVEPAKDDLNELKLAELKELAKEAGIEEAENKRSKKEVIELLEKK